MTKGKKIKHMKYLTLGEYRLILKINELIDVVNNLNSKTK
jgi:hypothetical protein